MSENKQKNLLFTPLKLAQKKISYNMGYSTKMLRWFLVSIMENVYIKYI